MPQTLAEPTFFLEEYVESILQNHGFSDLTPEDRDKLLPDFMEQALIRIGAGLSPHLSESAKEEFQKMVEKDDVTKEQWLEFWQKNIPNFKKVTQKILEDYAQEVEDAVKTAQ